MLFEVLSFATGNLISSFSTISSARGTARSMSKTNYPLTCRSPNNATATALSILASLSILIGGLTPIIGMSRSPLSAWGISGSPSGDILSFRTGQTSDETVAIDFVPTPL